MSSGYPDDWKQRARAVYKRDNYTCQDCGAQGGRAGDTELHAHHITPKSQGGSHRMENLETLCVSCHNDQHDHDITADDRPTHIFGIRVSALQRAFLSPLVFVFFYLGGGLALLLQLDGMVLIAASLGAGTAAGLATTRLRELYIYTGYGIPAVCVGYVYATTNTFQQTYTDLAAAAAQDSTLLVAGISIGLLYYAFAPLLATLSERAGVQLPLSDGH